MGLFMIIFIKGSLLGIIGWIFGALAIALGIGIISSDGWLRIKITIRFKYD